MLDREQAILAEALFFTAKSRAALVEKLLESLDQPDPSIVETPDDAEILFPLWSDISDSR